MTACAIPDDEAWGCLAASNALRHSELAPAFRPVGLSHLEARHPSFSVSHYSKQSSSVQLIMFRNNYDNDSVTLYAPARALPQFHSISHGASSSRLQSHESTTISWQIRQLHANTVKLARRKAESFKSNTPPKQSSKDPWSSASSAKRTPSSVPSRQVSSPTLFSPFLSSLIHLLFFLRHFPPPLPPLSHHTNN